MLQDAGLDAVALADAAGRVVWQGVYSPYGEVLRSEGLISAEDSRIGHHGLFFDRFGAAAGEATLAPGAGGLGAGAGTGGGVYHARHRGYTPGTGRFMQGDPNATGLALVTDPMWHSGMAPPSLGPAGFDALGHYGDGMGRYAYTRSNPVGGSDPLGLCDFSLVGVLGGSTTASELRNDWGQQVVDAGMTVGQSIGGMFDGFSLYQLADACWAEDWDAADDDYSTSAWRSGAGAGGGGGGSGPVYAGVFGAEDALRAAAAASRHGSSRHYTAMAEDTLRFMTSNGIRLKDADIVFNKALRNEAGEVMRMGGKSVRPDVIISVAGQVRGVIETAVSQSQGSLNNKIGLIGKMLKKYGKSAASVVGRKH